jgi:predicted membrane protein
MFLDSSSSSVTKTGLLGKSTSRFSFVSRGSFITMLFNASTIVMTFLLLHIPTNMTQMCQLSLASFPFILLVAGRLFCQYTQDYFVSLHHVLSICFITIHYLPYNATPCTIHITLSSYSLLPASKGHLSIKRTFLTTGLTRLSIL